MAALNDLAAAQFDETKTYADVLHVVHVFVIEPHPAAEPSPYNGEVWEVDCSDYGQASAYADRVETAKAIGASIGPGQLQLVDDLDRDGRVNPVWCTYGPAPNPAFLIRQDGLIAESQQWADMDEMKLAADRLLAR